MIRIYNADGTEWNQTDSIIGKAVKIEMWYDRHERMWRIWAEDVNGFQIDEARWGFGKAEALRIKAELKEELIG